LSSASNKALSVERASGIEALPSFDRHQHGGGRAVSRNRLRPFKARIQQLAETGLGFLDEPCRKMGGHEDSL
jgi:hypothetical protein